MPFRPGLDDDEALKNLIETWLQADDQLRIQMASVGRRIQNELRGPINPTKLRRLRAQEKRIQDLLVPVDLVLTDLIEDTDAWLTSGGLDRIYAAGAGRALPGPFSFTLPHRAAVDQMAQDLYKDVLTATDFVSADHKRVIREASSRLGRLGLTTGATPTQQARKFAKELERHGLGFVTYKDGSKHQIGEYSAMLFRTKSGIAYNQAGINVSKAAGIRFVEILDGTNCGLTGHNSTPLANNLIVPIEIAEAYPLSHPNCRRAIAPRPDLDKLPAKSPFKTPGLSVQSPLRRADQTAFESTLRRQGSSRARRFLDSARNAVAATVQAADSPFAQVAGGAARNRLQQLIAARLATRTARSVGLRALPPGPRPLRALGPGPQRRALPAGRPPRPALLPGRRPPALLPGAGNVTKPELRSAGLKTLVRDNLRKGRKAKPPTNAELVRLGISQADYNEAFAAAKLAARNKARRERREANARPSADVLARRGITSDEYDEALRLLPAARKNVREAAARDRDEIFQQIDDFNGTKMRRPSPRRRVVDPSTGAVRFVRDDAGYDFLELIDDVDRKRLDKNWLAADGLTPDEIANQIRLITGRDLSDDEAIDYLVDLWNRYDGLNAISAGRRPGYIDLDSITPADIAELGYRLEDLLDTNQPNAILHLAEAQKDDAIRAARHGFVNRTGERAAYELTLEEYLDEVDLLEAWVKSIRGADRATLSEQDLYALNRWAELIPDGLADDLTPDDLYARVMELARIARYVDDDGALLEDAPGFAPARGPRVDFDDEAFAFRDGLTFRSRTAPDFETGDVELADYILDTVDGIHRPRTDFTSSPTPLRLVIGEPRGDEPAGRFTPNFRDDISPDGTPRVFVSTSDKARNLEIPASEQIVNAFHELGHFGDFDFAERVYIAEAARPLWTELQIGTIKLDDLLALDLGEYGATVLDKFGQPVLKSGTLFPLEVTNEIRAMAIFLDTVWESSAIEQIRNSTFYPQAHKQYLLDPAEIWARAYAQYIVHTTGNSTLANEIKLANRLNPASQWDDFDFAPLIPLIEKVLDHRGGRL